jgi:cell division topological specificity factor
MFENIANFFKKLVKTETKQTPSKNTAKERLHLVLMQDRANVSADFLELMKQEIIEVIKKYIEVEETAIDVRLTNEVGEDGTQGAPSLYANIPILNIKNDMKKTEKKEENKEEKPADESKKNEEKVDDKEEIEDEEKTDKVEENKETENEVLEENKELKGEQEKVEEKQEENKEEKSAEESNKNEDKADENNENNTADKEE